MTYIGKIASRIGQGSTRKLLRRSFIYTLGRQLVRWKLWKFPYRATTLMFEHALEQVRRAYNAREVSVWTSAFFPVEVLHALGITPFSPEVAAAVIASMGFQDEMLSQAERQWAGRDSCSFHRCALGGIYAGYLPVPAAFCASTHLCDGAVDLFGLLSRRYNRPLFIMDVPYHKNREATEYVTAQLKDLIAFLEELAGKKLDPEKLKEAVARAEEARKWMNRVNCRRRDPLSPFQAKDAFNYLYMYFTGLGSPEMVEVYQTLEEEIAGLIERGEKKSRPRYRLLWLHMIPFFHNPIFSYLEEKGASVVFEEFSHVYWEQMNPSRPLESIAQRLLSHFSYGHINNRINVILELSRLFKADGVIHFSHWGCRQSCGGLKIIKDALQAEGLPLLVLDGDCIDRRNFAIGQIRTRIDAFVELLEHKREQGRNTVAVCRN